MYKINKPISSTLLTALVSAYFALVINNKIWAIYTDSHSVNSVSAAMEMLGFILFIYFLLFSMFSLVNFRHVQKGIYILLLLISAPALYFSVKFNTFYDQSMIRNLLETDVKEAADLLSVSFWLVMFFTGVLPSIIIWKLPISYEKYWKRIVFNSIQVSAAFVLALLSTYPYYGELSSFIRNERLQLLHSFLPYAPVNSLYQNFQANFKERKIVKEILDADAKIIVNQSALSKKPLVLIIILGETAREKSFNVSEKTDNESIDQLIDRKNLIYFNNFWSCGTNTAASVPCMFSTYSRDDFSRSFNKKYENVTEIIQRVGYDVLWKRNNNCKGICSHLTTEQVDLKNSEQYFHHGGFYDEALVDNLAAKITQKTIDQVIFLHQLGSHGPAYFKRVPEAYKIRQPACQSADFGDCDDQQIENAYDNTVLYTKYVIARAIDELEKISDDYDTALLYLSDHGESTGEYGYYLHGLPYFMAPDEQIHIPALVWMSDEFILSRNVDLSCMKAKESERFSHDNFSQTLLGILDIETTVYTPSLDLFDRCRVKRSLSD